MHFSGGRGRSPTLFRDFFGDPRKVPQDTFLILVILFPGSLAPAPFVYRQFLKGGIAQWGGWV